MTPPFFLFGLPKSFRVKSVKENTGETTHFILVGNKTDLSEERAVSEEEAKELANSLGLIGYIETSVKDNTNVTEVFEKLVDVITGQPESEPEEGKSEEPPADSETKPATEEGTAEPEKTTAEKPADSSEEKQDDKVKLESEHRHTRRGWCSC